MKNLILLLTGLFMLSCNNSVKNDADEWISLFNGENLDGWTVKISGYEAGDNFNNTFRAEEGMLRASYDLYDTFNGEFGHIFYNIPYDSYRLRMKYRFTGEQVQGGPGWAFRNSGVMLHSQDPLTMGIDQDFPVSIEAQFLGGDGHTERSTLNLCTPGTNVVIGGELITRHCTGSSSSTFHGDEWVEAEVVVYGDSLIHHLVNGDTVLTYMSPQIGGSDLPEGTSLPEGTPLGSGYISLQAESHPCDYRDIELQPIKR